VAREEREACEAHRSSRLAPPPLEEACPMTMRPHGRPLPPLLDAAWCRRCAGSAARWNVVGLRRVPPVARPASAWGPCAVGAVRRSPPRYASPRPGPGGTPMPTRAEVTTIHAHEDRAWARRATHHHTLARAPRRTAAAQALMPWSWRSWRGWRQRSRRWPLRPRSRTLPTGTVPTRRRRGTTGPPRPQTRGATTGVAAGVQTRGQAARWRVTTHFEA